MAWPPGARLGEALADLRAKIQTGFEELHEYDQDPVAEHRVNQPAGRSPTGHAARDPTHARGGANLGLQHQDLPRFPTGQQKMRNAWSAIP
jgi:hypothetical protein